MNVIVICLDTFRADFLGAAGRNGKVCTPNLDRIANEGIIFDNAFGDGLPTIQFRRALCTGMRSFPWRFNYDIRGLWPSGFGWHKIPPEQDTMAEVLLDNGYATCMIADTYHMFKPTQNFTRGMAAWDFIRGQETDNARLGRLTAEEKARYFPDRGGGFTNPTHCLPWVLNMRGRKTEDDYLPAKVFKRAGEFLEDATQVLPFFMWIDSFCPHEPFDPPDSYADKYDPDWDQDWEPMLSVRREHEPEVIKRYIARYYGYVEFLDKQIGRFLDKMEALKLMDDTLILVCSDHGTELMDHGNLNKGSHLGRYRHNNELLFTMRLPGGERARTRVNGIVQNQDIFPTIMKFLGVKHKPVDGKDFMPLVTGGKDSIRDCAVIGWRDHVNIRDHNESYGCYVVGDDPKEWLFDLRSDPDEMKDIAAENPEICAKWRGRIEAFLAERGLKPPLEFSGPNYPPKIPGLVWLEKSEVGRKML